MHFVKYLKKNHYYINYTMYPYNGIIWISQSIDSAVLRDMLKDDELEEGSSSTVPVANLQTPAKTPSKTPSK